MVPRRELSILLGFSVQGQDENPYGLPKFHYLRQNQMKALSIPSDAFALPQLFRLLSLRKVWVIALGALSCMAVLAHSSPAATYDHGTPANKPIRTVSSALISSCDGPPQVAPGHVAWWKFDEGTGDVTADSSGNGNTCVLGAGAAGKKPTWAAGKLGMALHFDGVDDLVNCGSGQSLNIRESVTVEAWIKPESTTVAGSRILSKGGPSLYAYDVAFSKPSHSPNPAWWLGLEHDGNHYGYSDNLVPLQEWAHVAMVYDRATVKLYVNGTPAMTPVPYTDTLLNTQNLPLSIGARYNSTWPFQGLIDEVRVYDRALTATEVAGNYGASGDVIVQAKFPYFSKSGTWSSFPGGNSNPFVYTATTAPSDVPRVATWSFTLPSSGSYKVYATWVAHPKIRAPDATYKIHNATPPATVSVDQRKNGEQWVRLGVFHFDAGPASISVSSASAVAGTQIVADAIRLVPVRVLSSTPFVIAQGASYSVERLAHEGADQLERMTCQAHEVLRDGVSGNASTGIALGTAADFPQLGVGGNFNPNDLLRRDEFMLQGHANGIYVLGATDWATDQALWELFYKLGYRKLGPGDNWEVLPKVVDLSAATASLSVLANPDYAYRQLAYDHSTGGAFYDKRFGEWRRRNRLDSGLRLSFTQAIGGDEGARLTGSGQWIGEYKALVGYIENNTSDAIIKGDGSNPQPNLCNSTLVNLLAEHAVDYFNRNPSADAISMEPPDGYTTCAPGSTPATDPLYSPSDQVVNLANVVGAALVAAGHSDKFVGILAYASHYAPPTLPIHPNVWVKVQENFDSQQNLTTLEAMTGWKAKMSSGSKQQIAVGRYLSTWVWWYSMPGQVPGADLVQAKQSFINDLGASGIDVVIGGDWVDAGLGYYLTGRMSLGVDQDFDTLLDHYFTMAFGAASAEVHAFYDELYRMHPQDPDINHFIMSQDLVARLYGHLQAARNIATDPAVQARLDDLVLYTRYLELRVMYLSTPGNKADSQNRQSAFETLIRHIYRIADRMIVNSYVLFTKLDSLDKDKLVTLPLSGGVQTPLEQWQIPAADDPLKDTTPFSETEIQAFVTDGIANNHTVEQLMTPQTFSSDLVPIEPMHVKHLPDTESGLSASKPVEYHVWVQPSASAEVTVTVTPNTSARVILDLHSVDANNQLTLESSDRRVPTPRHGYTVSLSARSSGGLHLLRVDSVQQEATVRWSDNAQGVQPADWAHHWLPYYSSSWTLRFYVPQGTTEVGGYSLSNSQGQILDPDGNTVLSFQDLYWQTGDAGFFKVPVPPGQDGKFWSFDSCKGARVLLTVPPWLMRDDIRALLPSEVVSADTSPASPWSVVYSKELVPATPLSLPAVPINGSFSNKPWFSQAVGRYGYFTWLNAPTSVTFSVSAQPIRDGKSARLDVSAVDPSGAKIPQFSDVHPFAGNSSGTYSITTTQLPAGLLHVLPSSYDWTVRWVSATMTSPLGLPQTLLHGPNMGWEFRDASPWTLYFYVPKGTTVVGGYYRESRYHELSGTLVDGAGTTLMDFSDGQLFPNRMGGYFEVAVPAGQDGKLWRFDNNKGRRLLMTVPPYLARSRDELLLPAEVVTADSP